MESRNIVMDDLTNEVDVTDDVETSMNDVPEDVAVSSANTEPIETESTNKGPSIKIQKDHPKEFIIINVMQDELGQFKINEVWDLVPRAEGINVIGTRWMYKNKSDEQGVVTRNKAKLISQGYTQMEGLDFDEIFAPEANLDVFPDVQTYLEKETSPDNDSSEKVEESVPEHAAFERRSKKKADECVPEHATHERRSKKKVDHIINVDELTSDEEPLTNIVTPGIAKRLQRRKGKAVVFEDSLSKEMKRKSSGLKINPSRSSIGKSPVCHTRSWSKVVTPTRKRKVVSSSDSKFDVEKDVQDITPIKRYATKKPHVAVPKAPLNNVSLHYVNC
ncbi:uncharacterized protein LOC127081570 [Lathyrus oleraceus]|uniref:uncharacterized protein LOC127081570 n=1 Tax=Pisum sativum TaxID=3888 RepID=UPI0021D300AC|nr:uncharacterized protein LOC127081570 [Pisum sativum]